jgi:23S rRNA (guanosine2251-2'-O)-methyltransferase
MKEWIVGRNPVYEVLRAGRRKVFRLWVARNADKKRHLGDALSIASRIGMRIEYVPRDRLDDVGGHHQGVALEVGEYPYHTLDDILNRARELEEPPFILILDTIHDTHNLGALLRTAEAVGVHGVLLPLRRTATVTPAVVHTSSGASEHLLVAQINLAQAIEVLKKDGIWVYGLEGKAKSVPISETNLGGPLALVVGNEAKGMRSLVRESCDVLINLPMRGHIDSLNAAVAGSTALYFAWQARKFAGA